MTIEIWLGLALTISIGVNIVLIWFSKLQSRQLLYTSQNLGDLIELLSNYREHLRKVYGLEMFYGDETLKGLMDHTNALVLLIQKEYGEITHLTDPLEVEFEKEEESAEKEEEEQEEQDVFYGGTRTSNS
jgi:hypothetical protein